MPKRGSDPPGGPGSFREQADDRTNPDARGDADVALRPRGPGLPPPRKRNDGVRPRDLGVLADGAGDDSRPRVAVLFRPDRPVQPRRGSPCGPMEPPAHHDPERPPPRAHG